LWSNEVELNTPENLVYRTAKYLMDRFQPTHGVAIELEKKIPITAGLGGGSSNAAVTMRVLNSLWELGLSDVDLGNIGAEFGSDVPFFLHGGSALGKGRGDEISALPDIDQDNLLLVNPRIAITSSEAYMMVQLPIEPRQWVGEDVIANAFNRLQVSVSKRYPVIDEIIDRMIDNGAHNAIMSGSGPTCIGFFKDDVTLISCQRQFLDLGYWTYNARTIGRDEYQRCFQNLS